MTSQFLRKVVVDLSGAKGLKINSDMSSTDDLRVAFSVEKSMSSVPNSGTVTLWNLSPAHRGMLMKEYTTIKVSAGYQGEIGSAGNVGLIFQADIRRAEHKSQNPRRSHKQPNPVGPSSAVNTRNDDGDWVTTLDCSDGGSGYAKGTVSKTYPAGSNVKEVMVDIAKTMPGISIGPVQGLDGAQPFTRAATFMGSSVDALNEIGRTHQVYWSIQDGAFQSVPGSGAIQSVIILSKESGLIGLPELTDRGIKLTALLNPGLVPGRIIEVHSILWPESTVRRFRIAKVRFEGDNMDGQFTADIEAETI